MATAAKPESKPESRQREIQELSDSYRDDITAPMYEVSSVRAKRTIRVPALPDWTTGRSRGDHVPAADNALIPRHAVRQVATALADTPVVMVNGPRQCGKTTLARGFAVNGRQYISLDDETALTAARDDPAGFLRPLDRAILDEVQRAPELLRAIKLSVRACPDFTDAEVRQDDDLGGVGWAGDFSRRSSSTRR